MLFLLVLRLKKINYSGKNIGNDLSFQFNVKGHGTLLRSKIFFGQSKSFKQVLFQKIFPEGSISLPISVDITEEDPIFNDTGSGSSHFNVRLEQSETHSHSFSADVIASGGDKAKKATFTFIMEAIVDVIKVELKECNTIINEDDLVYISDAPRMPQLKAKLRPDGLAGNVDWSLKIEFKRPNRNDKDTLTKTVAANSQWNIAQDFGTHFYGGKVVLTATYKGLDCKRTFHIRGTNPSENAAETEIGNNPFYAKAIARHESGTQNNRTYLQFNEVGTLGPDYLTNLKRTPNRSSDKKGWGIYQLTKPVPSRDQVWSWKANVAGGKALMNSNLAEAPAYFQAVRRKYPNQYESPPSTYTPPGTTTALTYLQAAAIQMFNGASVREDLPNPTGGVSEYRSCWKFYPNNPSGQRWQFVPNQNDYVKKIVKEYENP